MTICMAALCDNGNSVLVMADRMLTVTYPMEYQLESSERKIHILGDHALAMFAGDLVMGMQILDDATSTIQQSRLSLLPQMVDVIRASFVRARLQMVEHQCLTPRGLTLDEYFNRQHMLNPSLVQNIDQAFMQSGTGVSFLIAGWDGSKYSIFALVDPGAVYCLDAIGFHAIGSGSPHAIHVLLGANYSKNMPNEDAKELLAKARKASEVAPGVGIESDSLNLPHDLQEEKDNADSKGVTETSES